jgi:hypothetical protein
MQADSTAGDPDNAITSARPVIRLGKDATLRVYAEGASRPQSTSGEL